MKIDEKWVLNIKFILIPVALLNFGIFARYGKTFGAVRLGNFLGLPVNYLCFSVLTVVITSATKPVFGELVTDPIDVMAKIDTWAAVLIGHFICKIYFIFFNGWPLTRFLVPNSLPIFFQIKRLCYVSVSPTIGQSDVF
jgi:cytosine/uracil/thiamine/allantoin permease